MTLAERARVYAALGDPHRLRIVDELALGDRSPTELGELLDLPSNLLAHHLGVLEESGLVERRVSAGDRRRRYLVLRHHILVGLTPTRRLRPRMVLFVCTHNSARSQFAAALWREQTQGEADSAGTDPLPQVHPLAVRAAAERGVDLTAARPKGYPDVGIRPDLVVSVCDRALESGVPFDVERLHWSVPDPVEVGRIGAFRSAFAEIANRVDALTTEEDA